MYEHGDTITIRDSYNQDLTAIVVNKNSTFWERVKIACKIIKGISK